MKFFLQSKKSKKAAFQSYLYYFISILAILLIFFILFRIQLQNTYYEAQDISVRENLETFQNNMDDQLSSVFQLHVALQKNTNLNALRRSGEEYSRYLSSVDMRSFSLSNTLISDIIYLDFLNDTELSCFNTILKENGNYFLRKKNGNLLLPIEDYGHRTIHSFIYLSNGTEAELLCFPSLDDEKYSLFYTLNVEAIMNQLPSLLSDNMIAAYLTDGEGNVISHFSETEMTPFTELLSFGKEKIVKKERGDQILYTLMLYDNLYLSVFLSKKLLVQYADMAFRSTFGIVFLVIAIILILVFWTLQKTYIPLYQLVKKITHSPSGNFIEQLDTAFSTTLEHNKALQNKIEKYHAMMKESVLDAIVGDDMISENIDVGQIFNTEISHTFYIVVFHLQNAPDSTALEDAISAKFRAKSWILKKNKEALVLLLNFTETEKTPNKFVDLYPVLLNIYQHTGSKYPIAMSQGSSSPLDIPRLYENAIAASSYISYQQPIVVYEEPENVLSFPYQKLERFSSLLAARDFTMSRKLLAEFFAAIDENRDPDFYIRSLLIDITTAIVSEMNRANIKFKAYNSQYFEALYSCRSRSYQDSAPKLQSLLEKLIDIFETETADDSVIKKELQEILEQEYASPDLSISMLADHFGISVSYMSFLFQKYYEQNFSDYLWTLRVAKAKELLKNTEASVDKISIAVGYENVTSFRRRFKKETGMTPIQFRESFH